MAAGANSQPADQRTVRRHNLALVLQRLAATAPRSRARISEETGLNRSTVSSIVAELVERGFIREAGIEQEGSIGRPALSLELNPDGGLALGLEISADSIAAYAIDLAGVVRYRAFTYQDNGSRSPAEVMDDLVGIAADTISLSLSKEIPVAVTLALHGLVSGKTGRLLDAPHLGWRNVSIVDLWDAAALPAPLMIDNEANLAAYAELTLGLGKSLRTFGYVSGATGLGLGIVTDGQIYRGAHGFAGEFGHVTIQPDGPSSSWGGRGTLEVLAGQQALLRMSAITDRAGARRNEPDRVGAQLAKLAADGDVPTLAALEEVGTTLGVGLATLSNLLDFEAIILGGNLSLLENWLKPPIEIQIAERVLASKWTDSKVLFSELGREAAVRGAAQWSLQALLDNVGSGSVFK